MFIVQIWVNYVYWPWGFSSKNMVEKQGLRDTIYVIYTVYVVNKERKVVELQLRFLFYFKAKSPINFIQFLLKKKVSLHAGVPKSSAKLSYYTVYYKHRR